MPSLPHRTKALSPDLRLSAVQALHFVSSQTPLAGSSDAVGPASRRGAPALRRRSNVFTCVILSDWTCSISTRRALSHTPQHGSRQEWSRLWVGRSWKGWIPSSISTIIHGATYLALTWIAHIRVRIRTSKAIDPSGFGPEAPDIASRSWCRASDSHNFRGED